MEIFSPKKIVRRRQEMNMSRRVLAKKAGMTESGLFYVEKEIKIPKVSTISKIAKALKCSVIEFFVQKNRR